MKKVLTTIKLTFFAMFISAGLAGFCAMAYASVTFKANDPCPSAPESRICDDEPNFVGMGTYEGHVPSDPVCGCTAQGVRVYFPLGGE